MSDFPDSLEDIVVQAKAATQVALESGIKLLQIELVVPEIALQAQSLAQQFIPLLEEYGSGLKVLFPDTGAAALARRDWGDTSFTVSDMGSRNTPIEYKIADEDTAFLVVCPSAVEVQSVEKLSQLAGDRPVVLLIPQLEDVSIVGIGYAARQLRERFISQIETAYYFRVLDGAAVMRSYPNVWQVWLEKEDEQYELIAEEPNKPIGEALEILINKALGNTTDDSTVITQKQGGLFSEIGRFLKALSK
ncbi:MAG: DUF1995 family protein [Microcystaceae cyanobacterium]